MAFDSEKHTVVFMSYYANGVPIQTWAIATSKGIRYGHDIDTVRAVYEIPAAETCDTSERRLYYPTLRIEFVFPVEGTNKWDCKANCPWLILDGFGLKKIAIYAPGYRPSWVR